MPDKTALTMMEFLRGHSEEMPLWLDHYRAGDGLNRDAFFSSRIVYYPGHGSDGKAVRVFGGSSAAHCFVMVDYGYPEKTLRAELTSLNRGFKGYRLLDLISLTEAQVMPYPWSPSVSLTPREQQAAQNKGTWIKPPYGLLAILERETGFDSSHGPGRLAVLFLGADGILSYDVLFCQPGHQSAPFAVLLQDHGFGGNYDSFGRAGILARIVTQTAIRPQWLLVGSNTPAWDGYSKVPHVKADIGGMHAQPRHLYTQG